MKVNLGALGDEFFQKGSKTLLTQINKVNKAKFQENKNKMLELIASHRISVELQSHAAPSEFLEGTSGSLFGFIGFPANYDPINELLSFLEKNVKFIPAQKITSKGKINFTFSFPSKEDFNARFPLFWESGRSWIFAIEQGISGLGYYINNKYGRSQEGIQTESQVRQAKFKNTSFVSKIFTKFKEMSLK